MERPLVDYLQHFGFEREPFDQDPLPGFHFECPQQQGAEQRALRGPVRGKGLTILVADFGCGKTTILRRMLESLPETRFEVAVLVLVRRNDDPTAFLQRIARSFGIVSPSDDRPTLVGQLAGSLGKIQEQGRRSVLVVDQAHLLSGDVLEEVTGLLNLEGDGGRLLSLVLSGLPALDKELSRVTSIRQRIDVRVSIPAFDAETASRYLSERIEHAKGKAEVLHPVARDAIHRLARGIPRVMNTIADNALFEAFLAGRGAVVVEDVERAAWDLGLAEDDDLIVETAEPVLGPVDDDESEYATTIPEMSPLPGGADDVL